MREALKSSHSLSPADRWQWTSGAGAELEGETAESVRDGLVSDTGKRIRKSQFQKLSGQFIRVMELYTESQVIVRFWQRVFAGKAYVFR